MMNVRTWLAALLLTLTLAGTSYAEPQDKDWFIREIQPHFSVLFEKCGCPVYGFEDIVTWEDQDNPDVRYWNVTVIVSQKMNRHYWQTIGRVFTYKQGKDNKMQLLAISETFIWNPA